mmetsp:Transcript_167555/g.296652  ORF Transcript_167555/g.296652 Transcript_167555/m.296652 type:complete len:98 (-) Transcript_167555:221-514(-)
MSDLMLRVWTKVHIHTQPNDSLSASHMKAPAGTRCHQRIVHNTQLNKLAIQVRDMESGTTCISHARGSRRKSAQAFRSDVPDCSKNGFTKQKIPHSP